MRNHKRIRLITAVMLLAVSLLCLAGCKSGTAGPTGSTAGTAALAAVEPADSMEPSTAVTEPAGTAAEPNSEPTAASAAAAAEPSTEATQPDTNAAASGTEGTTPSANTTAGHTHSYTKTVTAATCTGNGYTTYSCACGSTYTADIVPAAGHSWGSWITTVEPTAETIGTAERICSVCGQTETKTLSKLAPETTQPDHDCVASKVITKEPTCSEDGSFDMVCDICGKVCWSDVIPALGHDIVNLGQVMLVREFAICPHCDVYLCELGSWVYTYSGINGDYIQLSTPCCDPNDALLDHIRETDGSFANHSWANDVECVTIVGSRIKCTRCGLVSIYDCEQWDFVPVDGVNDAPNHVSWRCGYCGTEHSTEEIAEYLPNP